MRTMLRDNGLYNLNVIYLCDIPVLMVKAAHDLEHRGVAPVPFGYTELDAQGQGALRHLKPHKRIRSRKTTWAWSEYDGR